MKNGFNIIVDAFWGSSGKGKLALALADRYPITDMSSSNLPNAGHTVVIDGKKIVNKILPSAIHVNRIPGNDRKHLEVWLSPSSAFWWRSLVSFVFSPTIGKFIVKYTSMEKFKTRVAALQHAEKMAYRLGLT